MRLPSIDDIRAAAARIQPHVHRTPVMTCSALDGLAGAQLFFKCENLQKVGAFKARGAMNAVFSLADAEAARGVVTHSSGNHGAALALAAARRGIRAHIVMPRTAPAVKREAVAGYGGNVILCEPTQQSREETLARVQAETGAVVIPPFNDVRIIAGQGTTALELLAQTGGLEIVMTPVGGGGLLSGTAIAVRALAPEVDVFGAEPANADDAFRSLKEGRIVPSENPKTIADGLLTSLGDLTFEAIRTHATGIVTVSEEGIVRAMRLLWERMKLVVEPSGAVPLAAVLEHPGTFAGKRVGLVLSGGNVELPG